MPINDAWALRLNCVDCREGRHDQYVEIADSPSLKLTDRYTLVAWVKLDHFQDGR